MKWIPDLLLGGLLATVAAAAVHAGHAELGTAVSHYSTWDYWFESDPPAFVSQVSEPLSPHHSRNSHHPLSSLLIVPLVRTIRGVLGVEPQAAIGLLLAGVAAAWTALFFALLRLLNLHRADAALFTTLSACGASVVFWFPVPETLAFGAVAMLAAVGVTALSERGFTPPPWVLVLVSAATLSFTSTDWMAGLLMLALVLPRRLALLAAASSLGVVGAAWVLQRMLFPSTGFPLALSTDAETLYLFNPEALGLLRKSAVFLFHSIVMPEAAEVYGFRLSVQAAAPGSGGLLPLVGVVLWSALLAAGAWGVARHRRSRTAGMIVALIAGQWALAMVFGVETFFYSSHWGPLLVLFCAVAAATPLRPIALVLAGALLPVTGANNVARFREAAARLHDRYAVQRDFTATIERLTPPEGLILCGLHAAAAQGEPPWPAGRNPGGAVADEIGLSEEPDTCYFHFDGLRPLRRGFMVSYEDWSLETIEAFRTRGARYFVTSYAYGIAGSSGLFGELDARFRRLASRPDWAFYDLSAEPRTALP